MIEIKNHFKSWAPKEACGVFTDTFNFIKCKNISPDNDLFCFCPEEYFNILDFKDAIVFCRFQTTNLNRKMAKRNQRKPLLQSM